MSTTQPATALGSRENWWGEKDVEELTETPLSELTPDELRRYIDSETEWNVAADRMDEPALRKYARGLRSGGHDAQPSVTEQERAEWNAHQILRQAADKLSKTALHGTPNRGWPAAFAFVFQHLDGLEPYDDHDPNAVHSERCRVELTDPCLHVPKDQEESFGPVEYGQFRHRRRYDPEHGYIGGVKLDDLPTEEFLEIVEVVLQTLKERHHFQEKRIEEWFALAKALKKQPTMSDEDVLADVLEAIYTDEGYN